MNKSLGSKPKYMDTYQPCFQPKYLKKVFLSIYNASTKVSPRNQMSSWCKVKGCREIFCIHHAGPMHKWICMPTDPSSLVEVNWHKLNEDKKWKRKETKNKLQRYLDSVGPLDIVSLCKLKHHASHELLVISKFRIRKLETLGSRSGMCMFWTHFSTKH